MPGVSKEAFRRPAAPKVERVPVAELGAEAYVCVRAITPRDWRELRADRGERPELGDFAFISDLVARSLCDESGNLLFADAEGRPDPKALVEDFGLSVGALDALAKAAMKTSGIGVEEKN